MDSSKTGGGDRVGTEDWIGDIWPQSTVEDEGSSWATGNAERIVKLIIIILYLNVKEPLKGSYFEI